MTEIFKQIPKGNLGNLIRTGTALGAALTMSYDAIRPTSVDAADIKCKGQTVPFEIVGKQVPFLDLERWGLGVLRPGIFDKGVQAPLDPYIEKPALGGQMIAASLDGKTEYQRDTFTQQAPTISFVPGLNQNVGYARVRFGAPCNADYVKPDGGIVPGLNLTLVSTQHPENTSYKTKIASGGVAVEWFGRELGVEHKTVNGQRETILHPEVIDRILKDAYEPVRDLNTETRAKLREAITLAIKKQEDIKGQPVPATPKVEEQPAISSNWFQDRLNDLGNETAHLTQWVGEHRLTAALFAVLAGLLLIRKVSPRHIFIKGRKVI